MRCKRVLYGDGEGRFGVELENGLFAFIDTRSEITTAPMIGIHPQSPISHMPYTSFKYAKDLCREEIECAMKWVEACDAIDSSKWVTNPNVDLAVRNHRMITKLFPENT